MVQKNTFESGKLYGIAILVFLLFLQRSMAYNLKQITNNNNLSNSSVTCLCQDERGVMMIGTCDGWNIYDSRDIRVYQPQDKENFLSGNLIDKIVYTGENEYWIQTYYGLNHYNIKTNTVVHYNEFRKLFFIEKDNDQTIFIISDSNSIFYYHAASASFKKLSVSGVIFSDIIRFFFDQNNILRIITNKGYHTCYQVKKDKQTGDITLISQECSLSLRTQLKNCFYDEGFLYVLTPDNDLYVYDLQSNHEEWICNLSDEIRTRGNISSIIRYHNNHFIGFKTDGVIVLEQSATGLQMEDLNINCGIFCLTKDRFQDLVWIGTDGQGVYIYSNCLYSMRSTVLSRMVQKMERPVRTIFLDHQNTLWIGSKGDGILKLYNYDFNQSANRSKHEALNTQNSALQDNAVYCFAKSKKPVLWIGNEEGLCYYSYKTGKIVRLDIQTDGKPFRYIHDVWETANDELWIASVGLGIVKAKIEEFGGQVRLTDPKHYTINNADFESNYFFSIYSENDSVFWFGNKGYGPFRYNILSDNIEPVNFFNIYENQTINDVVAISRDRQGAYLFGTGYGLVKYRSGEDYEIFNSKNGLPNSSIHALQKGEGSDFWLSTNRGLVVFNTKRNVFQIFDRNDGLQVEEFSDGASFRDERSNVLFFGGVNGFLAVRKDETLLNDYMPPIAFDRLSIFGNPYNLFEKTTEKKGETILHLKANENFFSLTFTAIDYLNSWNYTYYYRLSDVSEQWINNGSSNEAAFTNLSPGVYTLQVRYHNRVLDKESPVYSMIIKIAYPWYRSIYAFAFYVLATTAVIYFLIRHFRLRSFRRRQKMMHEIDKKRQKEVYEGKLRFFTNIAHEFCTPLTLISGPCECILAQKNLDPFVRNYIQMIQGNANRLNNLIRELIEFRKIETGNREPKIETVQVADLINEIESLFANLSESTHVALEIVSNPRIKWNTDKGFFTTILVNLVSNAFKYTTKGKNIRIETAIENERLLIRISNQSHSIKEKDFKRIFDRYTILENLENQDEKPAFSRNGLGLAISYNMVQLLKGDIRVENTPDQWVLFSVSLPMGVIDTTSANETVNLVQEYIPVIETPKSIQLPQTKIDRMKPTLLIIDDEAEVLWLISEIFSDKFNTITLQDATKIDELLQETMPDIIISDVMMPDLNGVDLLKKIKTSKDASHIPVVLVSGKYEIAQQIDAMEAGAELYVTKPFNAEFLKISVNQIMERKEKLKDYFSSPISAFDFSDGKTMHKEDIKFLQSVLKVIHENITENELSGQLIADKLHIGVRSLYRKLDEIEISSPRNLIKECRIQLARDMLLKSKMTIDEITYKSGFINKSTFFKAFHKKYVCTPGEYRKNAMEQEFYKEGASNEEK